MAGTPPSFTKAASIDPPDDHLYLGPSGGTARRLMDLAPDSDWCRTIVWTNDSRKVGFLIRDQRLAIFDTATGEQLAICNSCSRTVIPAARERETS